MNFKSLFKLFSRVIVSAVFAGIFYVVWMAAAIPILKSGIIWAKVLCWLTGPLITGAGFACGIWLFELLPGARKSKLRDIILWPLAGCYIGAAVVFPAGPMLIIFAMFIFGAVSVFIKEVRK